MKTLNGRAPFMRTPTRRKPQSTEIARSSVSVLSQAHRAECPHYPRSHGPQAFASECLCKEGSATTAAIYMPSSSLQPHSRRSLGLEQGLSSSGIPKSLHKLELGLVTCASIRMDKGFLVVLAFILTPIVLAIWAPCSLGLPQILPAPHVSLPHPQVDRLWP